MAGTIEGSTNHRRQSKITSETSDKTIRTVLLGTVLQMEVNRVSLGLLVRKEEGRLLLFLLLLPDGSGPRPPLRNVRPALLSARLGWSYLQFLLFVFPELRDRRHRPRANSMPAAYNQLSVASGR